MAADRLRGAAAVRPEADGAAALLPGGAFLHRPPNQGLRVGELLRHGGQPASVQPLPTASAELARQLRHQLAERHRVHVLRHQRQQEKVAQRQPLGHLSDVPGVGELCRGAQHRPAQRRGRHHHHAPGEGQHTGDGQQRQPEPQHHVDLLVEDIERQHTHWVDGLDAARAAN